MPLLRCPRTLAYTGPAAITLAVITIAGCSALPRSAVPADAVERAAVPGLPDIRAWGDEPELAIGRWTSERLEMERARLAAGGQDTLPDAAYLALSGGGENGAYCAGLLCGWTQAGTRPPFQVVTGVSAGALVAPFAFAGPEYDHVLQEIFTSLHTRDIANSRSLLSGLTGDSMYDPAPLRRLLERHVNRDFLAHVAAEYRKGRNLYIATTNLDSQRPVIWAMGRLADSNHPDAPRLFRDILLASASIPGVFPPVMIEVESAGKTFQEMHVDGGATSQVFLYPPTFDMQALVQQVHAQRHRTVYVVRNAGLRPQYEPVRRRTLAIAQRAVSSLIASQGVGDLYRIYLETLRDGMDFRLATIPASADRPTQEMFDPAYMSQLFELGSSAAKGGYAWSKAPPGFENWEQARPRGQTP
ncbi:MAG: patatin-like phospholipase family protein [Phycisphaerales bacterium]